METISVNKQLLQEDSRGTGKSDPDLSRRQESELLAELRGCHDTEYPCPPELHSFGSLSLPHLTVQEYKRHSFFHSVSQPPNPVPQCSPLSSPFPIFPQSLSSWPASHPIAREEADIPNFRYSPDLPCNLSAWNLQVSK